MIVRGVKRYSKFTWEVCITIYTHTEWIPFLSEVKLEHFQYFLTYWEQVYMYVFITTAF